MFVFRYCLAPFVGHGHGTPGFGIDIHHMCSGDALHILVAVDNPLLKHERLLANRGHSGVNLEAVVDICGGTECAVYGSYNGHTGLLFKVTAHKLLEIKQLTHIEKLDIYRIVQMTEEVYVVETYLNGYVMIKFKLRFRNFHYYQ